MKCSSKVMNLIGNQKMGTDAITHFDITQELAICRKYSTKNYFSISTNLTTSFNKNDRPVNAFECFPKGCKTTGFLTIAGTDADSGVIYRINEDATAFATGIIAFYVKTTEATAPASVGVKVYDVGNTTDFDRYDFEVSKVGVSPIIVDLAKEPTSEGGAGWTATDRGVDLEFIVPDGVAISSISIFDTIEEFNTSLDVTLGCLTEITGDIELQVADITCLSSGYDTSTMPTITKTINFKKMSPNWRYLNPLYSKPKTTTGFEVINDEVIPTEIAGTDFAVAYVPNASENECAWFGAMVSDGCDVMDSQLTRLKIPYGTFINEKQFVVVNAEEIETGRLGRAFVFNKALAGQKIIIKYPKDAEVEEVVANFENLEGVSTRWTTEKCLTDGTKLLRMYPRVLVTGFPDGITKTDDDITLTLTIMPDDDGTYYKEWRVIE